MEQIKKSGDVGASLPTEETSLDYSTTDEINPSSPVTRQVLDKLEDVALDLGLNIGISFGYDKLGNLTSVHLRNSKTNRSVKMKREDAFAVCGDIFYALSEVEA